MALNALWVLCLTWVLLHGAGTEENLSTRTWNNDLVHVLQEADTIATQQRLNVDEKPTFRYVLHAEELQAIGVKDLFDALALVPGIQTSIIQNGIKKVVMRGFDNPNSFVFDKFKLFVDSHPVNTVVFQNTSYYLDFPIELIERIEVILGPAAALETSGALTGVIKLTTKIHDEKQEGSLFVRGGSYDEVMAGIHESHRLGELTTLSLDGYYRKHDRMLDADDYELHHTLTRNPESSEWLKDASVGAVLQYGHLRLSGRVKQEHQGNYFGWEEFLENTTDTGMKGTYANLQGVYENRLNDTESVKIQLDYNHFRYDGDAQNYLKAAPGLYLPYTMKMVQSEAGWQFDASVTTRRFENHTVVVGWRGTASRQYDNTLKVAPPGSSVIDTTLTKKGLKRYLSSFYVTDTVSWSDRLDGRFALMYDHLSDLHKGYFSLDATLLYRLFEDLRVKVGYGHAYRAPSWVELYTIHLPGLRAGNPSLHAEEADTVEASFIYAPSMEHTLKLNLYYTDVENLIDNLEIPKAKTTDEPEYANYDNRDSKGMEFSYRFRPSLVHTFTMACAYNDTEYVTEKGYHQSMPGVAHWNGYIVYLFNLDASTSLSARFGYMGPRKAYKDYGKEDLDAYTTMDATYSYISPDGWKCFAGIKNLFDADVRDSSYYDRHDGIVRPGRSFFFTIEYPL